MKNRWAQLIIAVLVAPISTGVLAQEEDEDVSESVLEEVIITANRREQLMMDMNQSVQAISEVTLEMPTYTNINQVVNLVPGATAFGNKSPTKEAIQFRGSGVIQSGAADGIAPVGYYVDDIPFVDISTPTPPPIGTFDLQRIEILRGPQGTSFGQDSSAGSVILRTNPVDLDEFGFKVRGGVSSVKGVSGTGYNVGGVVNVPIVEDVFGFRLSYLREDDAGYGTVFSQPDYKDPTAYTRDSFRIKLFWQAGENVNFELTHSQWNTDYNILP